MRKIIPFVILGLALVLPGCSRIDEYLETQIQNKSQVTEDPNYKVYSSYYENDKLDQDGYIRVEPSAAEEVEEESAENQTVVSFSENVYLNVHYYKDPEFSYELNSNECKLETGESIYAQCSLKNNIPSSAYVFSEYRISEIDTDGDKQLIADISPDESGLILTVSDEYIGKELVVDPIGTYTEKTVTFSDSYVDNNDEEHPLSGKWYVNDKPVTERSANINPVSSYIISYEFDSNEYFYVDSDPHCFYSNNEDGIVIFRKSESTDETENYSVKLHQYVSINLKSAIERHVTLNNGFESTVPVNGYYKLSRLKYGDQITIVTDYEWKELENCRDLILRSLEPLTQSGQTAYRYTMIVPEKGSLFTFDPSEYTYEHGKIRFWCFGEEVTSVQYLAPESRIIYEEESAEDGYWLPEGNHVITVTTEEETRRQLQNIQFTEKIRVNVHLNQPEYGGKIEYYVNGSLIDDNLYTGDSGTEITMKFYPWEGWISNYKNGEKYLVNADAHQNVTINGGDVCNNAFKEYSDHKPNLEIVLLKSVGSNMKFTPDAAELEARKGDHYEAELFKNDYTIVNEQIGTGKGITISVKDGAIQSGTALKILVEMEGEDKSGSKTQKVSRRFYRLVDNLTELQEPINIYEDEERAVSSIWYKSIKISIGVVDVIKYIQPKLLSNQILNVRVPANENKILKNGDVLENSEKVTATITAEDGYYLEGKSIKNGVFQSTLRFDKCISELQKMVDEHPTQKCIQVSLIKEDKYGTCVYKVAGREVSGTVQLKPGDEILLEYTVTDPKCIISSNGLIGLVNKKTSSKKIKVDQSMDGATLGRVNFGIYVKDA